MSNLIASHLAKLGLPVKDQVTGYIGVVTSVTFDLYGCVQGFVTPAADKTGAIAEGRWFDIVRLTPLKDKPVMPQPDFVSGPVAEGRKGGQLLPAPPRS